MQKSIFLKCTAVLFLVRPQGLFMSVFIGSWGAAIVPRLVHKGGKTKTNRKSKTGSLSLSYPLSTEILTHFSYCDSPFRSSGGYCIIFYSRGFSYSYGRHRMKCLYSILFGTRSDIFSIMYMKLWSLLKFSGMC